MYLSHYNLNEKPFQISTDPRFLWLGEKHKEALAILKYGIIDNRGFLLLTGDVGTGKTTLINSLINSLDKKTIVAALPDARLQPLDFFNFIAYAFKIKTKFRSKGEFLIKFGSFLNKAYSRGYRILLIVDEAQRLMHELLEEIRLLSNLEKQQTKLINIFFVGQSEFNELLADPENRALRQRITINYNLEPLNAKETEEYIDFRLKIAGAENKIFNSASMREINTFSAGYPRLINIICDHALLTGYVKSLKIINAEIIRECIKELQLPASSPKIVIKKPKHTKKTEASAACVAGRKPLAGTYRYLFITLLIFLCIFFYTTVHKDQNIAAPEKHHPVDKSIDENNELLVAVEALPKKTEAATIEPPGPELAGRKVDPLQVVPVPEKKSVIYFNYNSNEFSEESLKLITKLSEAIRSHPEVEVIITGYTDSLGDRAYNNALSLFRANMVKSFMLGKGVDSRQIKTAGKGSANHVAGNDTFAGRRANRRVEIEVLVPRQ
jgi:general secretion pathway protein A